MTQLSNLTELTKSRKRVGRGGKRGGTSGKGGKGQKQRSGAKIGIIFEGGQMPLTRRLPKRGFNNKAFATEVEVVNLEHLENFFDNGTVITKELLQERGLISRSKQAQVKILGRGALSKKFTVHADAFSKSAEEAIKNKGGEVHVIKEK